MSKNNQMEKISKLKRGGLIKTIVVIVLALIVLGYFGFNITDILNGPTVQANLHAFWNFIMMIWNNFLAGPVEYIWNNFIVVIFQKILQAGVSAH